MRENIVVFIILADCDQVGEEVTKYKYYSGRQTGPASGATVVLFYNFQHPSSGLGWGSSTASGNVEIAAAAAYLLF